MLARKIIATAVLALTVYLTIAAFAPEEARAYGYTNCEPYNSVYDICTTWEFNYETGMWEQGEQFFVFRGEYAEIDPGEEP